MKIIEKKILFFLIGVAFLFFQTNTFAQEEIKDIKNIDLINLNIIPANAEAKRNIAVVQQVGNDNQAEILQQYAGSGINVSLLMQNGNNNIGFVQQVGAYLNTTLLQMGNANNANLFSSGKNITQNVQQAGNSNNVKTNFENFGNRVFNADLNQNGNNNTIDISFSGSNLNIGEQFILNQMGNNQSFTGDISTINSPIQVTQTPGIGGEGMQVNITTFPAGGR